MKKYEVESQIDAIAKHLIVLRDRALDGDDEAYALWEPAANALGECLRKARQKFGADFMFVSSANDAVRSLS